MNVCEENIKVAVIIILSCCVGCRITFLGNQNTVLERKRAGVGSTVISRGREKLLVKEVGREESGCKIVTSHSRISNGIRSAGTCIASICQILD